MKVAILHYWFVTWRGGEKVVKSLVEMYPDADIYTLFITDEIKQKFFPDNRVYASFLNSFKYCRSHHSKVFPLYPLGVLSLKLRDHYDLVISSESGPIKGVRKTTPFRHICYTHTPMRYCWGYTSEYLATLSKWQRPFAAFFFQLLKIYDRSTIKKVGKYIANSENVKNRIKQYYKKDAEVIFPPIALELFNRKTKSPAQKGSFFLSFGAITPYKRIDLLVDAFNELGYQLVVVGSGSEKEKLMKRSNPNIVFKGFLPDEELEDLIYNSRALIFPGEEDFGMIPLEVMAQGVPVIAYNKGGALETVVESKRVQESTGLFFDRQDVDSLIAAIKRFEQIEDQFDPDFIKHHARAFGEDVFKQKMDSAIKNFIYG